MYWSPLPSDELAAPEVFDRLNQLFTWVQGDCNVRPVDRAFRRRVQDIWNTDAGRMFIPDLRVKH